MNFENFEVHERVILSTMTIISIGRNPRTNKAT